MSQVNLLPPEVLQKLKTRRLTILIAIAGAVIVGMLILLWVARGQSVRDLELSLRAQEAVNNQLRGQITDLGDATTLDAAVTESDLTVATALRGEISWWSQMRDVQLVIPDFVGLASFSGTSNPAGLDAVTPEGFAVMGGLAFSGSAAGPTGAERVARWLGRSNSIVGWANPWLGSMTELGTYTGFYSFNSTVDLTVEALTARGQGAPEEGSA